MTWESGDFLTLTSDSNCRGTILVVINQLKKYIKYNLLDRRSIGFEVGEKPHLVGPQESDSYWLANMAKTPALTRLSQVPPLGFSSMTREKTEHLNYDCCPILNLATLFSRVGIQGQLKGPGTPLQAHSQHSWPAPRQTQEGTHAPGGKRSGSSWLPVAWVPSESIRRSLLVGMDKMLRRTISLIHGILLLIWHWSCPVFSRINVVRC